VETGQGLKLRFPTLEQAQDAFVRLEQKVSGPHWLMIKRVYEKPVSPYNST
jgi:hypothetical protein